MKPCIICSVHYNDTKVHLLQFEQFVAATARLPLKKFPEAALPVQQIVALKAAHSQAEHT